MTLDSLKARIRARPFKSYWSIKAVRWGSLVLVAFFLTWFVVLWKTPKPLIKLPKVTGSSLVARQLFDWTDGSRDRKLMVFVWYPAAAGAKGPRSEYLPKEWADRAQLPTGIVVNALERSPPREGRYPVLILSPAMGRIPADYTVLAEDLASHGYIVAGVTPTGSARVVVFPDGRIVRGHDYVDLQHRDLAQPLIERWVADFSFAVDRLLEEPALRDNIDSARIGVVGHSFGGAAAMLALHADRRFRRAANLDGAPEGQAVELDRPALFILATPLGPEQKLLNDKIYLEIRSSCEADKAGCHIESFPGARHMNFSDAGVLPRHFWQEGLHPEISSIDAPAFLRKVSQRLRVFFDAM